MSSICDEDVACLLTKGRLYLEAYDMHGNLQSLQEAMAIYHDLQRLAFNWGTYSLDNPTARLSRCLWIRFGRAGNPQDHTDALDLARKSVENTSGDALALGLLALCDTLRDGTDTLDECLSCSRAALDLVPPGHHLHAQALAMHVKTLVCIDSSSPASVKLSVENYLLRPDLDVLQRADLLHVLGSDIFAATNQEQARILCIRREVLTLLPQGNPRVPAASGSLAMSLLRRAEINGALGDINEAITLLAEVLNRFSNLGSGDRAFILVTLSQALETRFHCLGHLSDIDDAIVHSQEAIRLPWTGDSYRRACRWLRLGNALATRYDAIGDPDSLREAMSCFEAAHKELPVTHYLRAYTLNSLGDSIVNGLKDVNLADRAISILEEAVLVAKDQYIRELAMDNLAGAYHLRSYKDNSCSDLDRALELYKKVLQSSHDSPELHIAYTFHLATALLRRYLVAQGSEDAIECDTLLRKTLDYLPPGHPNRARSIFSLVQLYSMENVLGPPPVEVFSLFDGAMMDPSCSGHVRLKWVSRLLPLLVKRCLNSNWSLPELRRVHDVALSLIPQVAYFGLNIRTRLHILAKTEGISVNAATLAILSLHPGRALEILEQGRSIFWSQALRLRTGFEHIPSSLSEQLTLLARELEVDSFNLFGEEDAQAAWQTRHKQRREASDLFVSLLDKIRGIPGLERFLLSEEERTLVKAATYGPVVVLVSSEIACHALAITEGGVIHILRLETVTETWLHRSAGLWRGWTRRSQAIHRGRREICRNIRDATLIPPLPINTSEELDQLITEETALLHRIWDVIVQPVMQVLQIKASTDQRPRLWWCPSSTFAFLPIHAAGIYPDGPICSDFVISSYTPTIGALLRARAEMQPVPRTRTKALLAAVPRPYMSDIWDELPSTLDEINSVVQTIPETVPLRLPADEDIIHPSFAGTTATTVLCRLQDAHIVHLACHGVQNIESPLDSGFIMRDDILTIAKLMPLSLPNAFFAFLSACETAKGDLNQPDQAVHLAATMLFVGFKSVIGTMWAMGDDDGIIVAREIYRRLFQDGQEFLDHSVIPYALDAAVREIRARDPDPYRWTPYIHLGI